MTDLTERLDAIQKRADAVTEWRKHFHPPQSNIDYSQRDVPFLLDLARKQGAKLEAVREIADDVAAGASHSLLNKVIAQDLRAALGPTP